MHQNVEIAAKSLQVFARRHQRSIVASAVALMAGFAVTAIAVAPLAPDAALLPQTLIRESLTPEGLDTQVEALATQEISLTRSDITRATDSVQSLLGRLGVADAAAEAFLRSDPTARLLLAGRGGKMVQVRASADGRLQELVARYPAERGDQARTHFTRLTVGTVAGRWLAQLQTVPLGTQVRMGSGTIRQSLFGATDEAGLSDAVAVQLADIFAVDIDFHRELRKGDTFSVVYEALTADGEPVAWSEGTGRVLAAEFVNAGREHRAVWFAGADGRGAYYGPDGQSRRRVFLASPMEFSRVTSSFAMRLHPLQKTWRRHLGVDYGAPKGTPVRVVGDGVVDFAGWQSGYGNVVQVQHGNNKDTLYAHLSRIDVRKGQRVEQGQRIGAVGATGWATGPHLHFEFRVNGGQQDPLRVAKTAETLPLDAASRPRFAQTARSVEARLAVAQTLVGQRLRVE